ncbi:MAG: DUF2147 domain-containing protein [Deltaproteobacteria bacterium]|nr:DUF2147 domain-containing protein [Deltaproteobacteria bacterium]
MRPNLLGLAPLAAAAAFWTLGVASAAEPAPNEPAVAPATAPAAAPEQPKAEPAPKADASSPVGRWKTWDDNTGKAKSIITIYEESGRIFGKIEKLLDPEPGNPDPKCDKCDGDLKDKPINGMRVLWDLKKDGDEWSGGKVLDPENGKSYKCYIAVVEAGKKLKVRGYVGFSLLGRTQYWTRE